MSTPKSEKDLRLPLSRVKTIMKSSPDVEAVGPEPLYLVAKVTELFIMDLAKRAFKNSRTVLKGNLEYKNIAEVVENDDTLDFLREIIPQKITVKQFKEIIARKAARGDNSSSEESSEEASEEESEENSSDKE